MGSVSDLINLANFKIQEGITQQYNQPSQRASRMLQTISETLETNLEERRKKENQARLSGLLEKEIGNLESEYSVNEAGNISVRYKPKKTSKFPQAIKDATERLKKSTNSKEEFNQIALELETEYPTLYNSTVEKHLKKVSGVSTENPWKESGLTDLARNKVLGDITKGWEKIGSKTFKHDQLSARDLALKSGYINYAQDPEIMKAIKKLPTGEPIIEPRKEGLARIGKGRKYGAALERYQAGAVDAQGRPLTNKQFVDQTIKFIQDLQKKGNTIEEISQMLVEAEIDPNLFFDLD